MIRRYILPIVPSGNHIRWLRCLNNNTYGVKPFCTSSETNNNKMVETIGDGGMTRDEAYRELENLDFMTATKILFTAPPKRKKFGLDFHLVQLFFVCMPPLAVYLVAQYARSEMRKMDEELHKKKKQAEEEEKAREAEKINKEKEAISDIVNVKIRLDALEVTVKEIASETKKISQGLTQGKESHKKESGSVDDNVNKK